MQCPVSVARRSKSSFCWMVSCGSTTSNSVQGMPSSAMENSRTNAYGPKRAACILSSFVLRAGAIPAPTRDVSPDAQAARRDSRTAFNTLYRAGKLTRNLCRPGYRKAQGLHQTIRQSIDPRMDLKAALVSTRPGRSSSGRRCASARAHSTRRAGQPATADRSCERAWLGAARQRPGCAAAISR